MTKISIIALGWLGSSLYNSLTRQGYKAVGSFHSSSKGKKHEVYYDFKQLTLPDQLLNTDILVFNLTPSTIKSLSLFQSFLGQTKQRIIFISSTSVYGQTGVLTEKETPIPKTQNGKLLYACEKELLTRKNTTIIRPGGLYGQDRHPGKYLSGKTNISSAHAAINLISNNDLIKIIEMAIKTPRYQIINAINSNHPTKKEYYTHYCKKHGLTPPSFELESQQKGHKIIQTIHEELVINTSLP